MTYIPYLGTFFSHGTPVWPWPVIYIIILWEIKIKMRNKYRDTDSDSDSHSRLLFTSHLEFIFNLSAAPRHSPQLLTKIVSIHWNRPGQTKSVTSMSILPAVPVVSFFRVSGAPAGPHADLPFEVLSTTFIVLVLVLIRVNFIYRNRY